MLKTLSSLPVSLFIGLSVLAYGLFVFINNWVYSEPGHEILLIAYCIGSVLVFFALRFAKIGISVAFIVVLFFITFYANQKFDWRKSYIMDAKAGHYFAMEQYIENYPTYEENVFSWFTKTPKWVAFSKDCYEPLLKANNIKDAKNNTNRHCKTADSILNFYDVDIKSIIRDHYDKMQNTAFLLNKGRLSTKRKFEKCINNKKCAMIPLLPAGAEVEQQSEDFIEIRKQFWSLINDKKISQQNCDFFDFCRVMTGANTIAFDKI